MDLFVPFWQNIKDTCPTAKLHFIFSMLADKDIDDVLALINTFNLPINTWHIAKIDNMRALAVNQLSTKIITHLPKSTIYTYDSIVKATEGVEMQADCEDMILCFGSFHTIAESMMALGLAHNPRTL